MPTAKILVGIGRFGLLVPRRATLLGRVSDVEYSAYLRTV